MSIRLDAIYTSGLSQYSAQTTCVSSLARQSQRLMWPSSCISTARQRASGHASAWLGRRRLERKIPKTIGTRRRSLCNRTTERLTPSRERMASLLEIHRSSMIRLELRRSPHRLAWPRTARTRRTKVPIAQSPPNHHRTEPIDQVVREARSTAGDVGIGCSAGGAAAVLAGGGVGGSIVVVPSPRLSPAPDAFRGFWAAGLSPGEVFCPALTATCGFRLHPYGKMCHPGSAMDRAGRNKTLMMASNQTACSSAAEARRIRKTAPAANTRITAPLMPESSRTGVHATENACTRFAVT